MRLVEQQSFARAVGLLTLIVMGCGQDMPPRREDNHPAVSNTVVLSLRDVRLAGITSVVVGGMPRSRIALPIRLAGTIAVGPAGTSDGSRGQTGSVAVIPLPRPLLELVHVGGHIAIEAEHLDGHRVDAIVHDIRELSMGGARMMVAVVHSPAELRPGESVIASPTFASGAARAALTRDSVVVIPEAALMRDATRAFVFVQRDSTTFIQRRVIIEYLAPLTASSESTTVIVWEGVRAGERVVVNGVDKLLAAFSRAVVLDEDSHTRPRS